MWLWWNEESQAEHQWMEEPRLIRFIMHHKSYKQQTSIVISLRILKTSETWLVTNQHQVSRNTHFWCSGGSIKMTRNERNRWINDHNTFVLDHGWADGYIHTQTHKHHQSSLIYTHGHPHMGGVPRDIGFLLFYNLWLGASQHLG